MYYRPPAAWKPRAARLPSKVTLHGIGEVTNIKTVWIRQVNAASGQVIKKWRILGT